MEPLRRRVGPHGRVVAVQPLMGVRCSLTIGDESMLPALDATRFLGLTRSCCNPSRFPSRQIYSYFTLRAQLPRRCADSPSMSGRPCSRLSMKSGQRKRLFSRARLQRCGISNGRRPSATRSAQGPSAPAGRRPWETKGRTQFGWPSSTCSSPRAGVSSDRDETHAVDEHRV